MAHTLAFLNTTPHAEIVHCPTLRLFWRCWLLAIGIQIATHLRCVLSLRCGAALLLCPNEKTNSSLVHALEYFYECHGKASCIVLLHNQAYLCMELPEQS